MKNIFLTCIFMGGSFLMVGQIELVQPIPDITLVDHLSEPNNLTSLKGKILLIDFWASWCAPCRKANKKLVRLHKDYDSAHFQIVGISLDTDKTKWLKAVDKDNIEYTQFIDPHGFEAKSAIQFGVEALPASYLFDPTGRLIAINPTEQEIKKQILHFKQ